MNRLVCNSNAAVRHDQLPEPSRARGAPARILFLHGLEVGFATTTGNLEHYAGVRPDIDAVHVRLELPGWRAQLIRPFPLRLGELDYVYLRQLMFWRGYMRSLMAVSGPFPLAHFDAVHITTQQRGMVLFDRAALLPPHTHRRNDQVRDQY